MRTPMAWFCCLCLVLIIAAQPVAYGQPASVATDTELSVAYCVGYLNNVRSWTAQIMPKEPGPTRDAMLKSTAQTDRTLQRLRDYLLSKGYPSSYRDQGPILLAIKHGQDDFVECGGSITEETTRV